MLHPTEVSDPGPRVRSPWLRLPIVIVLFLIPVVIAAVIKEGMRSTGLNDYLALRLVHLVLVMLLLTGGYLLYVKWIERRKLDELRLDRALPETGVGLLIGFVLITLSVAVLWIAGIYQVNGFRFDLHIFKWPVLFVATVYLEELLFRGILLRLLDEALGSIPAVLISGLIFGLMHIANDGADLYSSFAVAVEGGIMVGLVWLLTRRLWMVLGLHYAWNTVQGALYGVEVSGTQQVGILKGELQGPQILTGGAFGLENTIVAVLFCLIAIVVLFRQVQKRGALRPPPWRRKSA